MSETTTTTTSGSTPADGTAANLSVSHIQNAVRVIDYACEAGAFKGWTVLMQVKELRDALDTFAKLVAPADEAATADVVSTDDSADVPADEEKDAPAAAPSKTKTKTKNTATAA